VLGSPNKLCAWSSQGVHTGLALTSIANQTNQVCAQTISMKGQSTLPNLHQVCAQTASVINLQQFCDEFYDHPPYPSALFHHKLCSQSIQGVHPDQPSTALSTKTSVVSLMQSLCDEPVHSTKLFTKSANIPTELSLQQNELETITIVTTIVVERATPPLSSR
jgi:hypothetical protein